MKPIMWRRLKERIKQKIKRSHPLVLAIRICLLTFVTALALSCLFGVSVQANSFTNQPNYNELSTWFEKQNAIRAIHHKIYVCGEEVEDLNLVSYEDVVMLSKQNPNWQIKVDENYSIIRFEEKINDLSPYCKTNAFFGLDTLGQFSLYDGIPQNEKVIKTFFQLNVPFLESKLPQGELEDLQLGIQVRNIEEYDSILSTYSEFRLDRYLP